MGKKITAIIAGIGLAALVISAVAAIQIGTDNATAQGGPNRAAGTQVANVHVDPDTTSELTSAEAEGLQFMREEEKLAQDVYTLLGAKYDSRVFGNISRSETEHTTTVKDFLDAFQVADPAAGNAAGIYENDDLQALYTQLVAQGQTSFTEAVKVGIAIEERDIADLKARIAGTDREDLKAMYSNLLRASENHLRTRQVDGSAGTGGQGYGGGQGQGGGQDGCY